MRNLPLHCKTFLQNVYRGCTPLYTFTLNWFYNALPPLDYMPQGQLKCASDVSTAALSPLAVISLALSRTYVAVFDVTSQPNPQLPSARASTEAFLARRLVNKLLDADVSPKNIAIITPYKTQLHELYKVFSLLSKEPLTIDRALGKADQNTLFLRPPLNIKTSKPRQYPEVSLGLVDSFQGREFDYLILSLGRNGTHTLGFLCDTFHPTLGLWKNGRLNVALSRQRKALIGLADVTAFEKNPFLNMHTASTSVSEVEHMQEQQTLPKHEDNNNNSAKNSMPMMDDDQMVDAPRRVHSRRKRLHLNCPSCAALAHRDGRQ
uniref:AAA_12 domain-containing protein n=1 Tax=Globodera pallida TaxID=36090 RepID=A0A183CJU9_GLOPA